MDINYEIMEEIKNLKPAIFVDAISFEDNTEEKKYLLLLKYYPDDEIHEGLKDWMIKIGRQNTYDFLKELIISESIDPNESFIISGDSDDSDIVEFNSKAITVFRFMKAMVESKKVLYDPDEFCIDDYGIEINIDKKIEDC